MSRTFPLPCSSLKWSPTINGGTGELWDNLRTRHVSHRLLVIYTRGTFGRVTMKVALSLYGYGCTVWSSLVFHIQNVHKIVSRGSGYLPCQWRSYFSIGINWMQWKTLNASQDVLEGRPKLKLFTIAGNRVILPSNVHISSKTSLTTTRGPYTWLKLYSPHFDPLLLWYGKLRTVHLHPWTRRSDWKLELTPLYTFQDPLIGQHTRRTALKMRWISRTDRVHQL